MATTAKGTTRARSIRWPGVGVVALYGPGLGHVPSEPYYDPDVDLLYFLGSPGPDEPMYVVARLDR